MTKLNVKIGEVFSRLTVLRRLKNNKHNRPVFECRCSCGKLMHTSSNALQTGNTKSCGCLLVDNGRLQAHHMSDKNRRPPLEAAVRDTRNAYAYGAKKRGLEFLLNAEQIASLITKACYYCGTVPERKHRRGLLLSGIDRKNNNHGYTAENCVPACSRCNFAKNQDPASDFIEWAKSVRRCVVSSP